MIKYSSKSIIFLFLKLKVSFMIISPKISSTLSKKFKGHIAISLYGKIIGIGKDAILALQNAKEKMPAIEESDFLVSRIHHDEVLAV